MEPWCSGADSQWTVTALKVSCSLFPSETRWFLQTLVIPLCISGLTANRQAGPSRGWLGMKTWRRYWSGPGVWPAPIPKPLRIHFRLSAAGKLCAALGNLLSSICGWSQNQVPRNVVSPNGKFPRELEAIEKGNGYLELSEMKKGWCGCLSSTVSELFMFFDLPTHAPMAGRNDR